MIALADLVYIIVGLLIGGLVLGLLYWLICYCEAQFPGFPMIFKIIKIVFVILVVLLLIGLLLNMAGVPVVRVGNAAPAPAFR
jgi:hypothetical protein